MKKKNAHNILKKTAVVTTSAVMATTSIMSTVPINVLANDSYEEVVSLNDAAVKIERSEVSELTARSHWGNSSADLVMDGDTGTYLDSDYNNPDENLQWFQFTLNEAATISQVRIHPRTKSTNGRPESYKIYAGNSADSLKVVAEGDIDTASTTWTDITLETPVEASVVKVEVKTNDAEFNSNHVVTVAEIELYKTKVEEEEADAVVYGTDGYFGEDGKLYLHLNGKPDNVAHPDWVYQKVNGEHYAVSKETVTAPFYDEICIYGTEEHYWNYIYLDEEGNVDVSTTYNLQKPVVTIQVGDQQIPLESWENVTIDETFTDVPYVHVEGVNLHDITVQATGVGQSARPIEVTGNRRTVDIPLIYTTSDASKSGEYSILIAYASSFSFYRTVTVDVDESGITARKALRTKVEEANQLVEQDYTEDSWGVLESALANANTVLGNNVAPKATITSATTTLEEAISGLVEASKTDKTKLNEAIANYGNLESEHSNYKYYVNTLNKAKEIAADPEAIQDSIDYYARNLPAMYHMVLVSELNSKYKYGEGGFDYSTYKTETVIPVIRMYGITKYRTGSGYFENEENEGQMKDWYEEYLTAIEGLEEASEEEKYIGFYEDSDSPDDKQGSFSILDEKVVNVDGKATNQLTIQFNNSGIHPIYGQSKPNSNGETKFKKFSNMRGNYDNVRVHVYDENFKALGSTFLKDYHYIDGETSYEKGSVGTVTLSSYPKARYIALEFHDNNDETFSPWYYRLDEAVLAVDKTNLQTLYDQVKDYCRYTTVYLEEFKPALDEAKVVLDDVNAIQEDVDAAYAALDKAYARCVIQDYELDYYYDAEEVYANYTTATSAPLYAAVNESRVVFDENKATTEELKAIIADLDEKKNALEEVAEDAVEVEKGLNEKAIDNKNNKGYFTATEESRGDKIILHVEYYNDGMNYLTNKETGKLDLSNPSSFKVYVNNTYYTKENNTVSSSSKSIDGTKVKPLDGETTLDKGFQFDFETDPGKVTFHIYQDRKVQTYSLGTYMTDVDKNAPEVISIAPNSDGTIRVKFTEPVVIDDPNWKKSELTGEIDGRFWIGTLAKDKIYEVTAHDLPGNPVTFTVDHKDPVATVIYSETNPTNKDVTVTITLDESVYLTDSTENPGWKASADYKTFTKVFSENATESVRFHDNMSNEITVDVNVNNIDRVAPTVTVKDSSVGGNGYYSKLDLKLYDNTAIDYVVVNGEKRDLANNAWSDLNDQNVNYVQGKNTVEVYDVCGNKTVFEFYYDTVAPEVTVKDGSRGNNGYYSKLDLKLHDNNAIDYVVVNGEKKDLTNNAWSDLNDQNVDYVQGKNVVEVYDIYGNKTTFEFDYDTVAPTIAVKDSSKGNEGYYSKLDLKLHDNNAVDYVVVNGVKKDLANNAWSDLNDQNANYVQGKNVVEVYDVHGNKTTFEFIYDTIVPEINAENVTLQVGDQFDPMQGVTAYDQNVNVTSSIVVVNNNVNTEKPGDYEVTYAVEDKGGNRVEKTVRVTVEERENNGNHTGNIIKKIIRKVVKVIEDVFDWFF